MRNEGAILSSSLVKGASTPAGLGGLLAGAALAGIEYGRHGVRPQRGAVRASVGRSDVQHREAPRAIMAGMAAAAEDACYFRFPNQGPTERFHAPVGAPGAWACRCDAGPPGAAPAESTHWRPEEYPARELNVP